MSSWNWPVKSVQQQKGKFFFSNWAYHAWKSCLISEGPVFSCHLSSLVYKTQVWLKNSGAFLSRIFSFFLHIFVKKRCNQRVLFQQRFCRPHKQTEILDFSINMFAKKNCLKILQGQWINTSILFPIFKWL